MRFVGGPLHGQDIEFDRSGPFLYEEDVLPLSLGQTCTTCYVLRTYGARWEDGSTWRLDVMQAAGVEQALGQLLSAFMPDLPGAQIVREQAPERPSWQVGAGAAVWVDWDGEKMPGIISHRLAEDMYEVWITSPAFTGGLRVPQHRIAPRDA